MIIENPAALAFFLTDEIYLDQSDISGLTAPLEAQPEPQPIVVVETPAFSCNYTGNNQKNFLILCHYPGLDAMDEKHLIALTSALQRKELTMDDVAIVNLSVYADADTQQLQTYFKPQRLLLLGAKSRLKGWDALILNHLTDIENSKVLYTYSFGEMMGDRDKTKAFWEQMKLL
jgi:hypothetical protein